MLLVLSAPCQLLALAGPEHGRTIPLAVDVEPEFKGNRGTRSKPIPGPHLVYGFDCAERGGRADHARCCGLCEPDSEKDADAEWQAAMACCGEWRTNNVFARIGFTRALNDRPRRRAASARKLTWVISVQPSSRAHCRSRPRSRAAMISDTATIAAHMPKPATPIMKNVASFIGQDPSGPSTTLNRFFWFLQFPMPHPPNWRYGYSALQIHHDHGFAYAATTPRAIRPRTCQSSGRRHLVLSIERYTCHDRKPLRTRRGSHGAFYLHEGCTKIRPCVALLLLASTSTASPRVFRPWRVRMGWIARQEGSPNASVPHSNRFLVPSKGVAIGD